MSQRSSQLRDPITVSVDLGERSYPIYIGPNLLSRQDLFLRHLAGDQVCIVTNDVVADFYLQDMQALLADKKVDVVVLPDGEVYKTLASYQQVLDHLITNRHNRSTSIVALGGGVTGDIAGFAAATFQRGVNFVQVPTTLLAQVDSAVGGKTAVNHPAGKNMIGAFYQPQAVFADTNTLNTLGDREYRAGIAEVVKYGLIEDAEFFDWLAASVDPILAKDAQALAHIVKRSVEIKAQVVAQDERESGRRAILNFGHTFGHALETAAGYGVLLHGEAVAMGMSLAAKQSVKQELLSTAIVTKIDDLLSRFHLPTAVNRKFDVNELLSLMAVDKKVLDGNLRLILLSAIGEVMICDQIDQALLKQTLVEF